MKHNPSSLLVRGSVQMAALLMSFSLGAWFNRPVSPHWAVTGPASGGNGSSSPTPAPVTSRAGGAPAPALPASAAPAAAAAPHSPRAVSHYEALAREMAALGQPQTLAALHRIDRQGNGPEQRIARQLLVARFAELDPETALSYVDTLTGDEHVLQRTNALSAWAGKDPQSAAAWLEDRVLTGGVASEEDAQAAAAIAGEWAKAQPNAAWEWAMSLSEEVRGAAIIEIAGRLAETGSAAAMAAVNSLADSSDRAAALQPMAARWAESSPAKTSLWVQSLTGAEEQAGAASGLVSAWMSSDPMAASRWVSSLPAGQARDAAINAMVGSASLKNDPEAATLWAASVKDPALRKELVAQSLRRWQVHNPSAAAHWASAAAR